MVHAIGRKVPDTGKAAFVAWNAEVAGEVTLGQDSSVWFAATLRADIAPITLGDRSNVQDGCTLHVDTDAPLVIGPDVTVGHNAVLHGCTIEEGCLIGMGAVVLTGAVIGKESVVGAGALVTEGKVFPPRSLILGSPAKSHRRVDDAMAAGVRSNGAVYVALAREAAAEYREVEPREAGG